MCGLGVPAGSLRPFCVSTGPSCVSALLTCGQAGQVRQEAAHLRRSVRCVRGGVLSDTVGILPLLGVLPMVEGQRQTCWTVAVKLDVPLHLPLLVLRVACPPHLLGILDRKDDLQLHQDWNGGEG